MDEDSLSVLRDLVQEVRQLRLTIERALPQYLGRAETENQPVPPPVGEGDRLTPSAAHRLDELVREATAGLCGADAHPITGAPQ
ncbi:MAG: hypothetical protein ACYCW6_00205 [Candidatus Xenobia bacterium]